MPVAFLGKLWLKQFCGAKAGSRVAACDSEATAKPFTGLFGFDKFTIKSRNSNSITNLAIGYIRCCG